MERLEVAPGVHAVIQPDEGLGWSNSGFVARGGGLVIDTLYDLPSTRRMAALLAEVHPVPPRRVLNTHHNGDHCWGNQVFAEAEIIGHRRCAEMMSSEAGPDALAALAAAAGTGLPPHMEMLAEAFSRFDFSGITLVPPTTFVDGRLDVDLDGLAVELHHVGPAHTSGDVVAWLPTEGVVFCGDVLFHRCTPIGWDGTFDGWIAALDRILSWSPEVVVPGHGPVGGPGGLVDLREYLVYVRAESARHFEAGRSVAEACAAIELGPFAAWSEPWRLPFSVARAYREMEGQPADEPVDVLGLFELVWEMRERMLRR